MVEEIKCGCIRVQSSTNEWMDCIFLVAEVEKEKALKILQEAWDDFWKEGEGWCYGNFLGARLIEAGIAFEAYYSDTES